MNWESLSRWLSLFVFTVSGSAFLSYVIRVPALREWSDPAMALNTALCLMLLSIASAVRGK